MTTPATGSAGPPRSGDPLDRVRAAFDPEAFRAQGHALVDALAAHLAAAAARALPVMPALSPAAAVERFDDAFTDGPREELAALLARAVDASNHLHHPGYVGHQVTSPLPDAALAELVSALLNNGMAVYEMGPAASAMERSVLRWMARQLGLPVDAGGVLTSGGSLGNLTALLAARQAITGSAWQEGTAPDLAVLVSDQAHYSITRAAQIMGWGAGGAIAVETDARFRLRPDALEPALRRAQAAGRRPIALVASACSTAAGAYDPITACADFAARHGLWLHVDGAHGASAALSPRHRALLAGVERADSVVWDAHKLLLVPALTTAVLFRDAARGYEVFAQRASYLFEGRDEWWDVGRRTVECTKKMMALPLYTMLACHGERLFRDYIEGIFALATRFAARVAAAPDFELCCEPECDIVCFRLRPPGLDGAALDALNARVRQAVLAAGDFYLVQARLRDALWLRVTIIDPRTTDADLAALLDAIRAAGAS